jgi:hypothetical protein
MIVAMTVVKINAITVPADSGDELAKRSAKIMGRTPSGGSYPT